MSYRQTPVSELATDVGQTIRMPSNSYLTVDSRDRHQTYEAALAAPSSPYNFMITKSESIFNGFFTRIGVTEIQFPWALPNINGESNTIKVYVDGPADLSGVVALNIGFYTPTELAAEFQTVVNSFLATLGPGSTSVGSITCTYIGPSSGAIPPLTQTIPFSFEINFTGVGAYVGLAFSPDPQKLAFNNLFSMMSFIPATAGLAGVPGVPGSTVFTSNTFTAPTDCLYTPYIDIVSRRLVAYQSLYDTTTAPVNRNIICRLYLNNDNVPQPMPSTYWNGTAAVTVINEPVLIGQRPGTIYKQFRNPKLLRYVAEVPVGQVDFQVYDSLGNPLDDVFNTTYPKSATAQIPDYQLSLLASEN